MFSCIAQGFVVRKLLLLNYNLSGLVQEPSLSQNDFSSPQTCLSLASVTLPKNMGAKKLRYESSAIPIDSDSEVSIRSCSDAGLSSQHSKDGSPKSGDHVAKESKPVLPKSKAVEDIGGHITMERGFDSDAPLLESPFLYQVVGTFGTDGFYQDQGSLGTIGGSLSMLDAKGVFSSQFPNYLFAENRMQVIK
jgi:hypothetical protein